MTLDYAIAESMRPVCCGYNFKLIENPKNLLIYIFIEEAVLICLPKDNIWM